MLSFFVPFLYLSLLDNDLLSIPFVSYFMSGKLLIAACPWQ